MTKINQFISIIAGVITSLFVVGCDKNAHPDTVDDSQHATEVANDQDSQDATNKDASKDDTPNADEKMNGEDSKVEDAQTDDNWPETRDDAHALIYGPPSAFKNDPNDAVAFPADGAVGMPMDDGMMMRALYGVPAVEIEKDMPDDPAQNDELTTDEAIKVYKDASDEVEEVKEQEKADQNRDKKRVKKIPKKIEKKSKVKAVYGPPRR